ncbi:TPA: hypothetical protein ACGVAS_004492 [Vibrio vulnificus]|uniref:hypothetical protein n=1 Tax=Vibrio TaxID=662 RepID=UPI001A2DF0D6|nr:hypothetical protein [Vibrio vulnificus]MCF9448051.1 hypothetical protein [Vibrio parahaemolyticus]MCG6291526.1 hypothetical protein [Vibrio vulnificus]HAT8522035.1 DUF2971 domain-containing protein [Vibrio vulnificus]
MPYNDKEWYKRLAERSDMSSGLTHLTRESDLHGNVEDVLFKILCEKRLAASDPRVGLICGAQNAVCFQDIPLHSICQNVFYEQKKREENNYYKLRYRALGLMFDKSYAFSKGARPVVYDKTEDAKAYLPSDEWWRIVNLNLENPNHIVDWTHEREWRHLGDFSFELSKVTLLTINMATVNNLNERYKAVYGVDLISQLKGVVTLNNILF